MPNIGMFPILCGLGIRAVAVPASLCLLLGSPGKNGFRMRLGVSQSDAFLLHNLAEGGEYLEILATFVPDLPYVLNRGVPPTPANSWPGPNPNPCYVTPNPLSINTNLVSVGWNEVPWPVLWKLFPTQITSSSDCDMLASSAFPWISWFPDHSASRPLTIVMGYNS